MDNLLDSNQRFLQNIRIFYAGSLPPPLTPSAHLRVEIETSMEEDPDENRTVRLLSSPGSEHTETLLIHPSHEDQNL